MNRDDKENHKNTKKITTNSKRNDRLNNKRMHTDNKENR